MKHTLNKALKTACAASALALASSVAFAGGHGISACLITKTDTNPFFVKMKEGATAKAEELGITLKSYAGKIDGDHQSQVAAIETCIADGAKGILITASDTKAIVGPWRRRVTLVCWLLRWTHRLSRWMRRMRLLQQITS